MKQWWGRQRARPTMAHLLRAQQRYVHRLGIQFAAAVTYYSILAFVPVLMLTFSVLAFILTFVRRDWLRSIRVMVENGLGGAGPAADQVITIIDHAMRDWTAIGVVGLASAIWAGAGWVGNLKSAVRAMWRPSFALRERKRAIPAEIGVNLGILVALIIYIAATTAFSYAATKMGAIVARNLGIESAPGSGILFSLGPLALSFWVGLLLFLFLYRVLPEEHGRWEDVLSGSMLAASGMVILEILTSLLLEWFARYPAAAAFGPAIAVMLFFNLFAHLTLFTASWIATARGAPVLAEPAADSEVVAYGLRAKRRRRHRT